MSGAEKTDPKNQLKMSKFSIPLPTEITDDTFSKPRKIETKYSGILKEFLALEEKTETPKKKGKAFKRLKNRASFVLNYKNEDEKETSIDHFKQHIDLDLNDTYVSFGIKSKGKTLNNFSVM